MGSVNKLVLIGNLGRDAELKYTPSGAAVANFSVATTETWNDKGGQRQERTEWHNIDLWGKQAESVSTYLVKGKQVYIEGQIRTEEYTDKDGNKRKATKVRADRVVLLGKAGDDNTGGAAAPQRQRQSQDPRPPAQELQHVPDERLLDEDDIPF